MSSEDKYHQEHPEVNRALEADGSIAPGKHSETSPADRPRATARIALSAHVQRLARSLDIPSEDLAERIPEDTIRRTKYPVTQRVLPDGTTLFEQDPGIIEGVRALHHR